MEYISQTQSDANGNYHITWKDENGNTVVTEHNLFNIQVMFFYVDRWRYSPEIIKNYQSTIQIGVLVGDQNKYCIGLGLCNDLLKFNSYPIAGGNQGLQPCKSTTTVEECL